MKHRSTPLDPSPAGDEGREDPHLSALLRDHLQRHEPSAGLRAAIRTQVALKATAQDAAVTSVGPSGSMLLGWRAAGVGLVCGVALTLGFGLWLQPASFLATPSARVVPRDADLEETLLRGHIHAMGPGPLFQVASSDRHTVKPWFQGKLDFAPPVPDLSGGGFPLLGGRVEPLRGHDVAALVYAHDRHMVTVYVWPDEQTLAPDTLTRKGFHMSHWSEHGMQVWVVTDAGVPEVSRFVTAWRSNAFAKTGS